MLINMGQGVWVAPEDVQVVTNSCGLISLSMSGGTTQTFSMPPECVPEEFLKSVVNKVNNYIQESLVKQHDRVWQLHRGYND